MVSLTIAQRRGGAVVFWMERRGRKFVIKERGRLLSLEIQEDIPVGGGRGHRLIGEGGAPGKTVILGHEGSPGCARKP